MGEWGTGVFENDYALDSALDVMGSSDAPAFVDAYFDRVRSTLGASPDEGDLVDDWAEVASIVGVMELVVLATKLASGEPVELPQSLRRLTQEDSYRPTSANLSGAQRVAATLLGSEYLKTHQAEQYAHVARAAQFLSSRAEQA